MNASALAFGQLVEARQSIRQYRPEPVATEVVERLLRRATAAPSAHNKQPWRFIVLTDGDRRQALIDAMSDRFAEDLRADGVPSERISQLVERGRQRMGQPPLAIVLCMTLEDMDDYPDEARRQAERVMAVQSAALAGGHLLLAAAAEGLGACWICAPLFAPDVVRSALDLPQTWEAQAVVVIGHPAESGRNRARKPLQEVAVWR